MSIRNPKISIIVPVFNVEKHLTKCIDSILSQTFRNFELILIDDGSHDQSGTICDKYAETDYRIRVVHQKNQGVSSARNNGVEISRGDYICFVDSDDYLDLNYLEQLIKNEADIVLCGLVSETNKGNVVSIQRHNEYFALRKDINWELIFRCDSIFAPYCKLFRRSILEEFSILFPLEVSWGEDAVFVADYLLHVESLCMVESCGYHYVSYETEKRLTSSVRPDVVDTITSSREYVMEKFQEISKVDFGKVEKHLNYGIMKACGYFVKFLFEDQTMTFCKKWKILKRFMDNPYVIQGARKMVVPYSEIISKCVVTGNPMVALIMYRFLNYKAGKKDDS